MGFLSVLSMAHKWIAERAGSGDAVIDATAGGGVDTLALAELVGPKGIVYAFDIQQSALDRTRERLEAAGGHPQVQLLLQDHAGMAEAIAPELGGQVAAIMFNLGYLPGSDQSIVTQPESTIGALQATMGLLRPGGILTCVLYPGHPGGDLEAAAVEAWASALPQLVGQAVLYRQPQRSAAPYLIAVEKRKNG
ncbi:methyltransferase domain-containing protein [Paenibacillus sp. 1011MAR3C5]|uniref:class I SAM-dependent methyltransferase n=1 Tax=Paenibacillus sp. 1011MAR3C5 TaxID=1675787 RepID=UPI000E6C67EF|nr:class I SAM-dependent methyltransferase [Paenibacillus sp. 1011MAR3C5]RJE91235.1 methyltransferase domain-containing protein [Paenibacillus sp. 1011MAR3C5]